MSTIRGQQGYVLGAIRQAGRPLSADEVRELLRNSGIGLATVYRAVKRGVAEGVLRAIHLGSGGARYEPASLGHHHHFECDRCKRVFCVKGCPRGINKLVPLGFEFRSHDIVLGGLCKHCKEAVA